MSELLDSFINRMTEGGVFEMLFGKLLPSLSAVACYVFLGVALTVLSRATGIGRVWQAWVPFANLYLIGLLADVYTDNRLTTEADRARPFYTPSLLHTLASPPPHTGLWDRHRCGGSRRLGGVAALDRRRSHCFLPVVRCLDGGRDNRHAARHGGTYGGRSSCGLRGGDPVSGLHRHAPRGSLLRSEPYFHRAGGTSPCAVGAVGGLLPCGRRHRFLYLCRAAETHPGKAIQPPVPPSEDAPEPAPVEGTDG